MAINIRRRFSLVIYLAIAFVALSVIAYFIHYLIFRDIHHTFIRMIGDLAFLLLEVLLVVAIIERLLARREMQPKLEKLDMVVGALEARLLTLYFESLKRLGHL